MYFCIKIGWTIYYLTAKTLYKRLYDYRGFIFSYTPLLLTRIHTVRQYIVIHVFYCKINHKHTPGNKIPGVINILIPKNLFFLAVVIIK